MFNRQKARTAAWSVACLLVAQIGTQGAIAAPALEAINGNVGGAGTCGSWVPPPELAFFTFSYADNAVGGIAACGYSGGYTTLTAASGPLTLHSSLGPVVLGNPATSGSYTGAADATANYRSLGAAAHASITGGLPGSSLALFDSVGAATFADTLTATSPLVVNASPGTVRYRFNVDGSLSSLGAPGPFLFGETYAVLDVQHNSGPVFEVFNATVRRGGLGRISNSPPPPGWLTGTGSLSGRSTFYSVEFPITWGQAWDVKVGLLAFAYGTADTEFLSTATLAGLEFFDANHVAVNAFSISSASGTDYATAVPEPGVSLLLALGLAGLTAVPSLRRLDPAVAAPARCTGHRE